MCDDINYALLQIFQDYIRLTSKNRIRVTITSENIYTFWYFVFLTAFKFSLTARVWESNLKVNPIFRVKCQTYISKLISDVSISQVMVSEIHRNLYFTLNIRLTFKIFNSIYLKSIFRIKVSILC